jgi:hypothetical protein
MVPFEVLTKVAGNKYNQDNQNLGFPKIASIPLAEEFLPNFDLDRAYFFYGIAFGVVRYV